MSVFDLNSQNNNLDYKIIAGLERISQVFKTLLWEKSKIYNLTPIQIQLLIFVAHHHQSKCTVSYLAKEFNITKATISDTVKTLEQKGLIQKDSDYNDNRSYSIAITKKGSSIVLETETFVNPIVGIIEKSSEDDKLILWNNILNLIENLNKIDVISVQRTCYNCKFLNKTSNEFYCELLNQKLKNKDIRIDCNEFQVV